MLSPPMRRFTVVNPLFYMVDGVRYGMLGVSDTSPTIGFAIVAAICVLSVTAAFLILRSGYKLRG